jgi:hypothetical protein
VTELEALAAKVAELEARLAATVAPPRSEPVVLQTPYVYEPPLTTGYGTILGDDPFRRLGPRKTRQLAVAVAVARGAPVPVGAVPTGYLRDMGRLAEARAKGLSWRSALSECGLEVLDESEVAHQARVLRGELRGMWSALEPVMGVLEDRLVGNVRQDLYEHLIFSGCLSSGRYAIGVGQGLSKGACG